MARAGPAAEILSDPEAVLTLGVREAGSILTGRVIAHDADGLTEIAVSAGSLFLPQTAADLGARLRIRIEAQDVILSRTRPEGLSALNILPCEVASLRRGEGPGMMVQLRAGEESLLSRITQRSAAALGLEPGVTCFAIAKSRVGGVGRCGARHERAQPKHRSEGGCRPISRPQRPV